MEMTYAALAKSLGISLKSISSSTSAATSSNTTSLPVSFPAPAPASTATPERRLSPRRDTEDRPRTEVELENVRDKEEDNRKENEEPPESQLPAPVDSKVMEEVEKPAKVPEVPLEAGTEDAESGSDADAEGIIDSDIASSRPLSPNVAPLRESSRGENKAETAKSQSTEPASVSQGTDIDTSVETGKKDLEHHQAAQRESMTDEQLHHAKVLVLDLLGWGVPPEYLLQRGISHALLYTVFTDLRLRLPDAIFADCVKLVSAHS